MSDWPKDRKELMKFKLSGKRFFHDAFSYRDFLSYVREHKEMIAEAGLLTDEGGFSFTIRDTNGWTIPVFRVDNPSAYTVIHNYLKDNGY